jgi:hypothetical protein
VRLPARDPGSELRMPADPNRPGAPFCPWRQAQLPC